MNASGNLAGAVTLILACSPHLCAQWPAYPTTGVPKTADGKADLGGAVPRTPDGKPDFSGIWRFFDSPDAPAGSPTPAAARSSGIGVRIPGLLQFFDIGSTLADGLPFRPWATALRRQRSPKTTKIIPTPTVCRSA